MYAYADGKLKAKNYFVLFSVNKLGIMGIDILCSFINSLRNETNV